MSNVPTLYNLITYLYSIMLMIYYFKTMLFLVICTNIRLGRVREDYFLVWMSYPKVLLYFNNNNNFEVHIILNFNIFI